jgi:two-component system cell cycle response regulator
MAATSSPSFFRKPTADSALRFCEKLRELIASKTFRFEQQTLAVTTSIGLQSYTHTDGEKTVNQFVAAADAKLYEAKKAGRNRICSGVFE